MATKQSNPGELRTSRSHKDLPSGVELVQTLRGHKGYIGRLAWSPDGKMICTPSGDHSIRVWDAATGDCIYVLRSHKHTVNAVAIDPKSALLASGSRDKTIKLWDLQTGGLVRTLRGHRGRVWAVAIDPTGRFVASGSQDDTINIWPIESEEPHWSLNAHRNGVSSLAFDPSGEWIVSGGSDRLVKVWSVSDRRLVSTLEGHFNMVCGVAFDSTGRHVGSASSDGTVKLWETHSGRLIRTFERHTSGVRSVAFWASGTVYASNSLDGSVHIASTASEGVVDIPGAGSGYWPPGVVFHPTQPLLAAVGSDNGTHESNRDQLVKIWKFRPELIEARQPESTTYASAKIVLVGESGVGKTGLGWRLAHNEFREHASTHGQQFWVLAGVNRVRRDGAECEAVLWDLAGQPDYRLIHALFLDDADLVLLVFDPTRPDPFTDIDFWLKQFVGQTVGACNAAADAPPAMEAGSSVRRGARGSLKCPVILIAARSDRGAPWVTRAELEGFCRDRGVEAYLITSAKQNEGITSLRRHIRNLIPWDEKPATVTTDAFKQIKNYVLMRKGQAADGRVIVTPAGLRRELRERVGAEFSSIEIRTAVGHLENHGYVARLRTSRGTLRVLLAPELLNNLAASMVLEARRNPKGLGSLEEEPLLAGSYPFPELRDLIRSEKAVMLDAAVSMFLGHNICFRETDPLSRRTYLVFPGLINLKQAAIDDDAHFDDGPAYTVVGSVENVFASLVVLMGYAPAFTRTNQWRNHARYEIGAGFVCGFRLDDESSGKLDLAIYFAMNTPVPMRTLFQGLFESLLFQRELAIVRFEAAACSRGHGANRAVVRDAVLRGDGGLFCSRCGERVALAGASHQPVELTRLQVDAVDVSRRQADRRSRFEQILFRLKAYAMEAGVTPVCFISYAWGDAETENWVERLAGDLQKGGISILLDRWENSWVGASVPRFVERISSSTFVVVIGTEMYRQKYENSVPMRPYVLAAEGDLIGHRMIGSEDRKASVMPLLLAGSEDSSFPPLLHGRVYADFREGERYFDSALNLLLTMHRIETRQSLAVELKELLGNDESR